MSYRRSIRIHGKEKKSPRFSRKADADHWYHAQYRIKQFLKENIHVPLKVTTTLDEYFYASWLPKRKDLGHPKSTWGADEQRYRDYVEEEIGFFQVPKISQLHIRSTIKAVTEKHGHSINTRNRVRSLISKIFNDAMNEDPALRSDNPALNISFTDPRVGKKKPKHLRKETEILEFIRASKRLSDLHHAYASIALMAGPRKAEMIALRWNDFQPDNCELVIDEKYIQAEKRIAPGTKAGSDEHRVIPIPDDLVRVLEKWRDKTDWCDPESFILSKSDGSFFEGWELSQIHNDIRDSAKVDVTPHGLRHSFGRWFVVKGGPLKALQAILGHSNQAVTEIYSELAGKEIKGYRNTVQFNIDGSEE